LQTGSGFVKAREVYTRLRNERGEARNKIKKACPCGALCYLTRGPMSSFVMINSAIRQILSMAKRESYRVLVTIFIVGPSEWGCTVKPSFFIKPNIFILLLRTSPFIVFNPRVLAMFIRARMRRVPIP